MKRFKANLLVITAVLFLAGGSLVFAGGQKETPAPQGPGAARAQSDQQVSVANELTTVTGQINFVNLIHPVIKSGGTEYEMIVPRIDVYRAGVKEGQTITVKGYVVKGLPRGPYFDGSANADTTPMLLVSSATINGKSYDLSQWADHFKLALKYRGEYGPGPGYRGYGPMMGYGPRGRSGFGSRGWNGGGYGMGPGYGYGMGPGYGMGYGMGYGYGSEDSQ